MTVFEFTAGAEKNSKKFKYILFVPKDAWDSEFLF